MNILNLILLCTLLISARCSTTRYSPPWVEYCVVEVFVDNENQTQESDCFCVDHNMNSKTFDAFVAKVKLRMSDHYMASETVATVIANKDKIIEAKEYVMPLYYCQAYQALGPKEMAKMEKWAEKNRVERIKCEDNLNDW